jgi:hypothetical protein
MRGHVGDGVVQALIGYGGLGAGKGREQEKQNPGRLCNSHFHQFVSDLNK